MDAATLVETMRPRVWSGSETNKDHVASLIIDEKFEVEFEFVESLKTLFVSLLSLGRLAIRRHGRHCKGPAGSESVRKDNGRAHLFQRRSHTESQSYFLSRVNLKPSHTRTSRALM
jgi:hypothetical protein